MKDLINLGPDEGDQVSATFNQNELLQFVFGFQKKHFITMKHNLENWRAIIFHSAGILKWEKPFYPAITSGLTTVLFIFLWYLDLSLLTLFALTLLAVCVLDYTSPILLKFVFKPENWTGVQEKKFDDICREIFNAKVKLANFWISLRNAKEQKSTMVCQQCLS